MLSPKAPYETFGKSILIVEMHSRLGTNCYEQEHTQNLLTLRTFFQALILYSLTTLFSIFEATIIVLLPGLILLSKPFGLNTFLRMANTTSGNDEE